MSSPSGVSVSNSVLWAATASSNEVWPGSSPPMTKRASTLGLPAVTSSITSALYGVVTNTRAPQSSTM